MRSLFGRCPICAEALEISPDRKILICPEGDYQAEKESFDSRWNQFHKLMKEEKIDLRSDSGMEIIDNLLKDLQEMKIKKERA